MAIVNLANNFQSASTSSGKNLPQETSGAPSTLSVLGNGNNHSSELQPVSKASPADIRKINLSDNRVSKDEVKNEIEELQQFNQSIDRSLQFKVDEELGVTIVRVIDKETDELIRQFPPEELLNLSRRLKELNEQDSGNSGILLQEKV